MEISRLKNISLMKKIWIKWSPLCWILSEKVRERVINDRKDYMKSTYAQFWKSVINDVYSFMDFDREPINLIKIISGKYTKILISYKAFF